MIKKILIFSGIGVAGFALYRYFKSQVELALNYEYTVKDFAFLGIEGDNINVKTTIQITNKSNFELIINSFDLDLYYNNAKFATVVSNSRVEIKPNTTFDIQAFGSIAKTSVKESLPVFLANIMARKPIDVVIDGTMKFELMGIKSTVKYDKQKVNYTADFASEWGFGETLDKAKAKFPKLFGLFE